MRTFYALFIIVLFTIASHAGNAMTTPSFPAPAPGFLSINGSINNNKVILEWKVTENESANQFEVEKSEDGKNFIVAVLVFGTDKTDVDQYQFYEKSTGKKLVYRIKLINKDQQVVYSPVIEINPGKSKL